MQTLYYAITGRPEEQKSVQKDQPFETFFSLENPGDQTINQIQRKIRLNNEFKKYIKNADKRTIYYHYIIDTEIYEGLKREEHDLVGIIRETYIIKPGFFGNLYEYKTTENTDDFFRTLAILEL